MAYARFVLHGFIELVIIIALYPKDGTCYERIVSINDTNVDLVFELNATDHLELACYKSERIGRCLIFDVFSKCYTYDPAVFWLSANVSSMVVLTLRILVFNESMTGNYTCQYMFDNRKRQTIRMSTPVNLTSLVMGPTLCTPYPMYNETTLYTCITSPSRPRAAINWLEDGRNITNMSSYTYVSDVTTSVLRYLPTVNRQANVSCIAIYEYRVALISITKSTRAFVQFPVSKPTVSFRDVNVSGTVTVLEGDRVKFHCNADGFPLPMYTWNFQGQSHDGPILELQINRTYNGSMLICSASNNLLTLNGSLSATPYTDRTPIIVKVLSSPHSPVQAHVVADLITKNSVKIQWVLNENGDDPDTITLFWKMDNIAYWNAITIPSAITSFYLQGLEQGKKYEVKLTTENIAGVSNGTDILTFETEASAHVASIVGGVIGGAFGLIIFCTLTFVIYRKNLMKRDKQPLPENSYEDLTKTRSPTTDLESYCTPAGPVADCYEETGFHGRGNPTYIKDVPQEQAENYEYVANTKPQKKDVTPNQFDSRIYSN